MLNLFVILFIPLLCGRIIGFAKIKHVDTLRQNGALFE